MSCFFQSSVAPRPSLPLPSGCRCLVAAMEPECRHAIRQLPCCQPRNMLLLTHLRLNLHPPSWPSPIDRTIACPHATKAVFFYNPGNPFPFFLVQFPICASRASAYPSHNPPRRRPDQPPILVPFVTQGKKTPWIRLFLQEKKTHPAKWRAIRNPAG